MPKEEFGRALTEVLTGLTRACDDELFGKSREQLEEYWFFRWDDSASLVMNLYHFHDLLGLYSRQCRRWEEHHHGSVCVVERVRDTYMLPKIRELEKQLMKLSS